MKKERAFIFDLDGVIVDTAKYHFLAWKNLANSLGFNFTEEQNEQLKGVSRVKSLEILLEIGNVKLSQEEKDSLLAKKNDEYLQYVNKMTEKEILPGVSNVLHFLDSNKIKYALGSASKNAQLIIDKVGLSNKFSAIVDGNAVSKAKPNPEVFLKAAEKLDVTPSNCIVFEDAIAGVQAANKAQMISIGIGDSAVLSEADYVFENMTKLSTDFLQNLIN